ncbi:MAG: hypothetical protein BHW58_02200 [Azospirillum sp. 51_20]|nr:MAG: hypothetical protein BHW58_02200 [Azospirillum sp. 51_20]
MSTESSEEKTPFWKSKTVIGSVVAVICGILSLCGIDISADTQATITDNLMSVIAGIASLYGLFVALKGK